MSASYPLDRSMSKDGRNMLLRFLTLTMAALAGLGLTIQIAGCLATNDDQSDDNEIPISDQLPAPYQIYFSTNDRYLLHGEALYPAPRIAGDPFPKPLPCAILLHGEHGSRNDWERYSPGFIENLRNAGFFVLVIDMRGHLESKVRYNSGEPGHACRSMADCKGRNCSGGLCGTYYGEGEAVQRWEIIENATTWDEEQWRLVRHDLEAALGAVAWWTSHGNPFDVEKIFVIGAGVAANEILRTEPLSVGTDGEDWQNGQDRLNELKEEQWAKESGTSPLTMAGGVLLSPVVLGLDQTTASDFKQLAAGLTVPVLVAVGGEHQSAIDAMSALQEGAQTSEITATPMIEATMAPGIDKSGPQLLGAAPSMQEDIIGWLSYMAGLTR